MKKTRLLLTLLSMLLTTELSFAATIFTPRSLSVMTDTNGAVVAPTNFWTMNRAALMSSVETVVQAEALDVYSDLITVEDGDGTLGYNGWPSLVLLSNSLHVFWTSQDTHGNVSTNNTLYMRTSTDSGVTWSDRSVVVGPTTNRAVFGPSASATADGTIVVSFESYYSDTGDLEETTNCSVWFTYSTNAGETWVAPQRVTTNSDGCYTAARGRPVELSDGRFMIPAYDMTNTGSVLQSKPFVAITESLSSPAWSYHYISNSWCFLCEPNIIEDRTTNGTLYAFIRYLAGNYTYRSVSTDYGTNWSTPAIAIVNWGSSTNQGPPDPGWLPDGTLGLALDWDRSDGHIAFLRDSDGTGIGHASWDDARAGITRQDEIGISGYPSWVSLDPQTLGVAFYNEVESTNAVVMFTTIRITDDGRILGRRQLATTLHAPAGTQGDPGLYLGGAGGSGMGLRFDITGDRGELYVDGAQIPSMWWKGSQVGQTNTFVSGTFSCIGATLSNSLSFNGIPNGTPSDTNNVWIWMQVSVGGTNAYMPVYK